MKAALFLLNVGCTYRVCCACEHLTRIFKNIGRQGAICHILLEPSFVVIIKFPVRIHTFVTEAAHDTPKNHTASTYSMVSHASACSLSAPWAQTVLCLGVPLYSTGKYSCLSP